MRHNKNNLTNFSAIESSLQDFQNLSISRLESLSRGARRRLATAEAFYCASCCEVLCVGKGFLIIEL
jgi:hypothetical protein